MLLSISSAKPLRIWESIFSCSGVCAPVESVTCQSSVPAPVAEIAKASYDIDNYKQIMGVVARRLQDTEEDWRHVYKSLLLLEFMSKHGPQKVSIVDCH